MIESIVPVRFAVEPFRRQSSRSARSACCASPPELRDNPFESIDQGRHTSVAIGALPGFLEQPNLMPFRIVQVGHPTVRPARRRSQELGPTAAQLVVTEPKVLHANHKETLGRSTALPWRATVDRDPGRPRGARDDVALVGEYRPA